MKVLKVRSSGLGSPSEVRAKKLNNKSPVSVINNLKYYTAIVVKIMI